VAHIRKFGAASYELQTHPLYADAFVGPGAPKNFQSWRSPALAARLKELDLGLDEGPLLAPLQVKKSKSKPVSVRISGLWGGNFTHQVSFDEKPKQGPALAVLRALVGTKWEAAGGWADERAHPGWRYALTLKFETPDPGGSTPASLHALGWSYRYGESEPRGAEDVRCAVSGALKAAAEWTLLEVPEAHKAVFGSKVGSAETEQLAGMAVGEQLKLEAVGEHPDMNPSTFRLLLTEPATNFPARPGAEEVLAKQAALVEELDWDELPKEEAAAQRAELRGVCAGGQLRLARVEGALPPLEQGARPRHDQLR
jgi:hypothetical protein